MKTTRIRLECYNCRCLFGSVFGPKCMARKNVGDIDDKDMCDAYEPISNIGDKEIREKKGDHERK